MRIGVVFGRVIEILGLLLLGSTLLVSTAASGKGSQVVVLLVVGLVFWGLGDWLAEYVQTGDMRASLGSAGRMLIFALILGVVLGATHLFRK